MLLNSNCVTEDYNRKLYLPASITSDPGVDIVKNMLGNTFSSSQSEGKNINPDIGWTLLTAAFYDDVYFSHCISSSMRYVGYVVILSRSVLRKGYFYLTLIHILYFTPVGKNHQYQLDIRQDVHRN
jgi:fermentation-respiration switch protein FrsA (DUF1100 family)